MVAPLLAANGADLRRATGVEPSIVAESGWLWQPAHTTAIGARSASLICQVIAAPASISRSRYVGRYRPLRIRMPRQHDRPPLLIQIEHVVVLHLPGHIRIRNHRLEQLATRTGADRDCLDGLVPVSYTHLTLPTIYSV